MRTYICVSTGVAPFAAMFGRNASASLEMVFGAPPTLPQDAADMYEYTTHLHSRMAKAHAYVRKNMRSAVDRQRQAYYRQTYQPTQPVWLWTPRLRPGQSRKFALYWTGPWQIKLQLNELIYEITPHHSWARQGLEAVSIDRLKPFHAMYVDALEHHCPPDPKANLKMLGNEFAKFIDSDLDEEMTPGRQPSNTCRLAFIRLRPQAQHPPPLTHRPLRSWNMQHIRCHLQFSTTKMMQHMHPRCGLVRDKLAEGEDREEWTPRQLMGITGISDSLFLRHYWYVMQLSRKISADKDEKSTNDEEQSKKGS
jgi:hypothetical protein